MEVACNWLKVMSSDNLCD